MQDEAPTPAAEVLTRATSTWTLALTAEASRMAQADETSLWRLSDGVGADAAEFAAGAFGARPDGFEKSLDPIDRVEIFRAPPELEVAPAVRFRPEARSSQ